MSMKVETYLTESEAGTQAAADGLQLIREAI